MGYIKKTNFKLNLDQVTFNYIITCFNKSELIGKVIKSIINNSHRKSKIYTVIDGCTDNTEGEINKIIRQYPQRKIVKLYTDNVHEIKSKNYALSKVKQTGFGFNIILQDDVLLLDKNFENNICSIYNTIGYFKCGFLTFRHCLIPKFDSNSKTLEEENIRESIFGTGLSNNPIYKNSLIPTVISVGSPECISFNTFKKIGYFNEDLSPCTYDSHDYSIRCIKMGLINYLYSTKYESKLEWGSTRINPNNSFNQIVIRNKEYLFKKYILDKPIIDKYISKINSLEILYFDKNNKLENLKLLLKYKFKRSLVLKGFVFLKLLILRYKNSQINNKVRINLLLLISLFKYFSIGTIFKFLIDYLFITKLFEIRSFNYKTKSCLLINVRNSTSDRGETISIVSGLEYNWNLIKNNIKKNYVNVFDVGANIGLFTICINKYVPINNAVLLEPDPSNFEQLKINIHNNLKSKNIVLIQYALTNSNKNYYFDTSLSHHTKKISNKGILVKGITLKSLVNIYPFKKDIIKIDIEGTELSLLTKSNITQFKQFGLIILEYHITEIDTLRNILKYFRNIGTILAISNKTRNTGILYVQTK